jgi:RNA 3'-terminal phosphate cyclase (ATP)
MYFRGYYPKGGGEVVIEVQPLKSLAPVELTERGDIVEITGRAFVAGMLPIKVSS